MTFNLMSVYDNTYTGDWTPNAGNDDAGGIVSASAASAYSTPNTLNTSADSGPFVSENVATLPVTSSSGFAFPSVEKFLDGLNSAAKTALTGYATVNQIKNTAAQSKLNAQIAKSNIDLQSKEVDANQAIKTAQFEAAVDVAELQSKAAVANEIAKSESTGTGQFLNSLLTGTTKQDASNRIMVLIALGGLVVAYLQYKKRGGK